MQWLVAIMRHGVLQSAWYWVPIRGFMRSQMPGRRRWINGTIVKICSISCHCSNTDQSLQGNNLKDVLRRITGSGKPSQCWQSATSASAAIPRRAGMRTTLTTREAAHRLNLANVLLNNRLLSLRQNQEPGRDLGPKDCPVNGTSATDSQLMSDS